MRWVINPADSLRKLTREICYARGAAAVCRDVLHIVQDTDRSASDRLREIMVYYQETTAGKGANPLVEHPDYHPKLRDNNVPKEYKILAEFLDEEPRHGYIMGKLAAISVIYGMAVDYDVRSIPDILNEIAGFCLMAVDIAGGERP